MKTIEIKKQEYTLEQAVDLLNQSRGDAIEGTVIAALMEGIKVENQERVKAAVADFAELAHEDREKFWDQYIQSPFAEIVKLKEDRANSQYELVTAQRRIFFEAVDHAYWDAHKDTIAGDRHYEWMVQRFTHNLHKGVCERLSEDAKKVITVQGHFKDSPDVKVDFSGTSINKLREQLQAIVNAILPEGRRPRVAKADVRYIQECFSSGKNRRTKTGSERDVLALVFDAVYVRTNDVAYEVRSMAKCHRTPRSEISERSDAQEEKASRIPDRAESLPKMELNKGGKPVKKAPVKQAGEQPQEAAPKAEEKRSA